MNLLYNLALYLGFLFLTPKFLYDKLTDGKWAAGFKQRLGNVPELDSGGRRVVLLHCVSVGEANAVLPLAKLIKEQFPRVALVVSTTTRTGQEVARGAYKDIADLIVYFPFDLNGAVRWFLRRIRPDVILLTETELWFNFIRTAAKRDKNVVLINGRLSERSLRRYSLIKGTMKRLLANLDLALMQDEDDAKRIISLGAETAKVHVTGNVKYDIGPSANTELTNSLRHRFGLGERPLIIAASTHEPEEQILIEAFEQVRSFSKGKEPRLMLVPRHPERFDRIADIVRKRGLSLARRSDEPSEKDASADVILLDSVGELRSAYPLADIVFVGGSLIPHGGQSIFEPAAAGKAIVTGPHTSNFRAAVREFLARDALVQLADADVTGIASAFEQLLSDVQRRETLGRNALQVIEANRGAAQRTLDHLRPFLSSRG